MPFEDPYGLEISCSSDDALHAYLAGIDQALRLDRSGIQEFEDTIAIEEDFALAHAALGYQKFIRGDDTSAHDLERAVALAASVSDREQSHIRVIAAAASGKAGATALAEAHIADFPQDVFVLSQLVSPFGMYAFAGIRDWHEKNRFLLEETRSSYSVTDWWHVTTRGFVLAECGDLDAGKSECERAWALSENGNTAHSLAHLHFEAVALDEGRDFIRTWASDYADSSDMRHHMRWHLCLLDIECGIDLQELISVYEEELDPIHGEKIPLETYSDNASLLWRCLLAGVEIPERILHDLHEYTEANFPTSGFGFADLHRAMSTALQPRKKEHDALTNRLSVLAERENTPVAELSHEFANAVDAFVDGEYQEAAERLLPVMESNAIFGGSNPQRRIIEETYLEACQRAGMREEALAVLDRRNRPASVFDQRQKERANA